MFKAKKLIELQKTLRRGTEVIGSNNKTYKFDGFHNVECPHVYCDLHPVNINKASSSKDEICQGFMIWYNDEEKHVACPFAGAQSFTIEDQLTVKYIKKTKIDPVSKEQVEELLKPEDY